MRWVLFALYGHPDPGGYWENHCEDLLKSVGITPVPSWRSVFWHEKLKVLLTVYVDDFKMSGPKEAVKEAWGLIRSGIKTEDPHPLGLYLGCEHTFSEKGVDGKPVRVIEYRMEKFLVSAINKYLGFTKGKVKLRPATTPFIPDPPQGEEDKEGSRPAGTLHKDAASMLMTVMWAARYARPDLLKAVQHLACYLTKWDDLCDKAMYRLFCYINSTIHYMHSGWIDDPVTDLSMHFYADADFAGCRKTKLDRTQVVG